MANRVEAVARNMRLTDNMREYVEKKAAKLDRYLQEIDEIRVELSLVKTARSASDRQVAQITVRGKRFILRTEERADDLHAAFDTALDKMQRQIDRVRQHGPKLVVADPADGLSELGRQRAFPVRRLRPVLERPEHP